MGNTINGILSWDKLLAKYESSIRNTFKLHAKYTQAVNKKLNGIKKIALKSHSKFAVGTKKKKKKQKMLNTDIPEMIYVGIHVR